MTEQNPSPSGNNLPSIDIGNKDFLYIYAKTEKIAHALLFVLERKGGEGKPLAVRLTECVLDLVSLAASSALEPASRTIFSSLLLETISFVRLAGSTGVIDRQSAALIAEELTKVFDRVVHLSQGKALLQESDFFVGENLPLLPQKVPGLEDLFRAPQENPARPTRSAHPAAQTPPSHKRHDKGQMSDRSQLVLDVVKEKGRVAIRDIAGAISGCSEKTIQRELSSLIERGLVKKEGDRRWSLYSLAK